MMKSGSKFDCSFFPFPFRFGSRVRAIPGSSSRTDGCVGTVPGPLDDGVDWRDPTSGESCGGGRVRRKSSDTVAGTTPSSFDGFLPPSAPYLRTRKHMQ